MNTEPNAVERALAAWLEQNPGKAKNDLAAAIECFPQQLNRWLREGLVPGHHCIALERAVRGAVTCAELNPPVFIGRDPVGLVAGAADAKQQAAA
jgi:DNA-binding transcriptional regulator YdaS (Cro superfamily)